MKTIPAQQAMQERGGVVPQDGDGTALSVPANSVMWNVRPRLKWVNTTHDEYVDRELPASERQCYLYCNFGVVVPGQTKCVPTGFVVPVKFKEYGVADAAEVMAATATMIEHVVAVASGMVEESKA
jgi:hypothetical protein